MSGADATKRSGTRTPLEWAREEGARDPYEDELQHEADALLRATSERAVVIDNGGGNKTIIEADGSVRPVADALASTREVKERARETKEERQLRFAETVALLEDPNLCGSCGKAYGSQNVFLMQV